MLETPICSSHMGRYMLVGKYMAEFHKTDYVNNVARTIYLVATVGEFIVATLCLEIYEPGSLEKGYTVNESKSIVSSGYYVEFISKPKAPYF